MDSNPDYSLQRVKCFNVFEFFFIAVVKLKKILWYSVYFYVLDANVRD